MLDKLDYVYGEVTAAQIYTKLQTLLDKYSHLKERAPVLEPSARVSERDVMLITYGDMVQSPGSSHLQTLHQFLNKYLKETVNCVHILPFYPYSSDDGFSVIDYKAVDPNLGTWDDIAALHQDYKIMFDGVVNHISAQSVWFKAFLAQETPYKDYFVLSDPDLDLSTVTRPRALPLLTPFETPNGTKQVWTTFSDDQIDLNFANPAVLLEIIELLLFYVDKGADFIRLDAIGYMWKQLYTTCIHLPQAHKIVQLWRDVMDYCAPNTLLVTETNVPHRDNIGYFGDGTNEAQLVYNFSLVPLTLHALQSGNAGYLTEWADRLEKPSDSTCFFNFLASHDGCGVMPARGILPESEINRMVERTLAHGGKVSYKNNADGTQSPYELNITFFDALNNPDNSDDEETKINRFLVSQAIMLAMQGVPGIYFHSLLGSSNWYEGLQLTGRNRTLNRQKLDLRVLEPALAANDSRTAKVFSRYNQLLKARTSQKAFHPNAPQEILRLDNRLFALKRGKGDEQVIAIQNVSNEKVAVNLPGKWYDLLKASPVELSHLEPYTILWLKPA
jgi:glucosylglycerate phosphorylase